MKIRIGTRGSTLALRQTQIIIDAFKQINNKIEFEIIKINTKGDINQKDSIVSLGGKQVFVKEIQQQLLTKKIDLAIHSMKDTSCHNNLQSELFAFGIRANAHDVLVINSKHKSFELLPDKAIIGTSSIRRIAELKTFNCEYQFKALRGNIESRIKKLENQEYDAIVVAAAALERLQLKNLITHTFSYDEVIPAPSQGIIGIEVLKNNLELIALIKQITSPATNLQAKVERLFLKTTDADCTTPIGAIATIKNNQVNVQLMLADINLKKVLHHEFTTNCDAVLKKTEEIGIALKGEINE